MASGTINGTTSNKYIEARVTWTSTPNVNNNNSTVTATLALRKSSVSGQTTYGTASITLTVNGANTVFTNYLTIPANNTWVTVGSKTVTVAHNIDGTKSITISASGGISGTSYKTTNLSGTATLDTIARESTISATSANVGGSSAIVITKKNSNYTHSIAYSFGSLSGYIDYDGVTTPIESKFSNANVNFTIPQEFNSQLATATSRVCTLTCKTYNGSTQIGNAQTTTFTISVSSSSAPTVSGNVYDSNSTTTALTGDSSKLVKYFSTAYCTISATAKDGASITSKSINNNLVTGSNLSIPNVETATFKFSATDSRGLTSTATVTKTLINYVKLTNNINASRISPTGDIISLKLSGNYFNSTFGSTSNTLTLKYRYKPKNGSYGSYTTVSPTKSGNTYTYSATLSGFPYNQSYVIEVVATDKLMTVTKTIDINLGLPLFDWGQNDFNFNVPVTITGFSVDSMLSNIGRASGTTLSIAHINGGTDIHRVWTPVSEQIVSGKSYRLSVDMCGYTDTTGTATTEFSIKLAETSASTDIYGQVLCSYAPNERPDSFTVEFTATQNANYLYIYSRTMTDATVRISVGVKESSGGGASFIRVGCSSTASQTISTSTDWANIEIPFDTVKLTYGSGLSLDASGWHSIDCSKTGYLEISGSAYFKGTAAYNKYMSLHIVSGNNTEIMGVKRSAIEGPMSIGPYIVQYSSSMKYFTLCARSDATNASIAPNNTATWFQVKYIA